jgi:hypothetical protein
MEVRFLGKETSGGDSPTLYATDSGSYLVQGWRVTDPEVLAKLDVGEDETCVEIYARLLAHLAKDGLSGVVVSWTPPIVCVLESGNLIICGQRVTDAGTRAKLKLPDHEDVVEVSRSALVALLGEDGSDGADNPG